MNSTRAPTVTVALDSGSHINAQLHRRPQAVRCKLMLDGLAAVQLMPHLGHSEPQQLC
jgi:hypothetical protein